MAVKYSLVHDLAQSVANDPDLANQIRANPVQALQQIAAAPPPLQTDAWIYRIVVGSLGMAVILSVLGAIILSGLKITEIPQILTAIGSAAVGALAGLLAPSPNSKN